MRDVTSPSSPQWVHVGLCLHPLPLMASNSRNYNDLFRRENEIFKVPKFCPKIYPKMPCHKKQMDQGSRRPLRKKLFIENV